MPLVALCAWAFGAPGVLIGQALGGVVFGTVAFFLARKVIREGRMPEDRDPFARQARLLSLLNLRR